MTSTVHGDNGPDTVLLTYVAQNNCAGTEGVLYLSMIRALYDNSIVAYKTASRQTVNLTG